MSSTADTAEWTPRPPVSGRGSPGPGRRFVRDGPTSEGHGAGQNSRRRHHDATPTPRPRRGSPGAPARRVATKRRFDGAAGKRPTRCRAVGRAGAGASRHRRRRQNRSRGEQEGEVKSRLAPASSSGHRRRAPKLGIRPTGSTREVKGEGVEGSLPVGNAVDRGDVSWHTARGRRFRCVPGRVVVRALVAKIGQGATVRLPEDSRFACRRIRPRSRPDNFGHRRPKTGSSRLGRLAHVRRVWLRGVA